MLVVQLERFVFQGPLIDAARDAVFAHHLAQRIRRDNPRGRLPIL